jgi:integrase
MTTRKATKGRAGHYRWRSKTTVQLLVYDAEACKYVSRYVPATSDNQARKALAKFVTDVAAGQVPSSKLKPTVEEAANAWLRRKEELGRVRESTLEAYGWAVGHIVREIGSRRVRSLTRATELEDLYGRLGKRLGPKSVKEIAGVLYGVLEYARKQDWVRTNVARDVEERPRAPHKPVESPDEGDVQRFLVEAQKVDFAFFAYVIVCAAAGGRRAEVLGLQRADVLLDSGEIFFRRQVTKRRRTHDTHGNEIGGPRLVVTDQLKTADGRRRVAVGDGTMAVLRELLRQLDERARDFDVIAYPAEGFLFSPDVDGRSPLMPDSINKRFRAIVVKTGVRITPHMLRHHAATAVAPFLTETDMMGRFGWRTSTMVRRYVDYKGAKDREAGEHADRALGMSTEDAEKSASA